MSAVRRTDRRTNRNKYSSPYARPRKHSSELHDKKSNWSISGLFRFLNPFAGSRKPKGSDRDDADLSDEESPAPEAPSQSYPPPPPSQPMRLEDFQEFAPIAILQAASANQMPQPPTNQLPFPPNPPQPQVASSSRSQTSTIVRELEPVARFFVEKAGEPLNEFEAVGIVDYIHRNVQVPAADNSEPFRFSTSPSRGCTPNLGNGSSNTSDVSSAQTPRKTLSRNPNGVYRWQGAGSSRPRNRYQSPGFGPRSQPSRIKLSPPKMPLTTDAKRRRVIDEAEPSTTLQRVPVPSTSTVSFPPSSTESLAHSIQSDTGLSTSVSDGKVPAVLASAAPVTPRANGIQTSRLRTSGLVTKPTAPAVPSPLRQAWKQSDSPPQPSPPSRPTRAAGFMTELIKEVTPTKKVDVSNPYQTASPVKPPARKPIPKRPRPSTKPVEKPKEKEREFSAQEIIEATVPKGSKRSRPPPEMEKTTRADDNEGNKPALAPAVNGFAPPPHFRGPGDLTMVKNVVDEDESPAKKRKTTAALPKVAVQVEEVVDVDEEDESSSKKRKTTVALPKAAVQVEEVVDAEVSKEVPATEIAHPAEVIEPGGDTSVSDGKPITPSLAPSPPAAVPKPVLGMKSSAPKEPSKLRYSYQADKVEVVSTESTAPRMPAPPPFASLFAPPPAATASAKAKLAPQDEVLAMNVNELPKYNFYVKETSYPAGTSLVHARETVISMPVSSLPTFDFRPIPVRSLNGFNWTAAGMKAPTAVSDQKWKCATCELANPASATEKCTICEAPRPASTTSAKPTPIATTSSGASVTPLVPPKAFDWSAAGLARPAQSQGNSWTCSLCGLSNPASATAKCTVCEAPR
ncbi:hypothetical protein F5I97DRAFT_1923189 [Phlebopus sp. FC_14]|nr:hypothetical protein F5I97DRAFT_1923189 [Phlebopus sp. FC_14]